MNTKTSKPRVHNPRLARILARHPIVDLVDGTYTVAGRTFPLAAQVRTA